MDVPRLHHKIIPSIDQLLDPLASARMQPKVLQSGPMRAEVMNFNASGTLVVEGAARLDVCGGPAPGDRGRAAQAQAP